jgi:uncharacterized protein YutD
VPALAEIHAEVVDDYRRARAAEILQQSEQELIGRYRVVVGDLARRSQP